MTGNAIGERFVVISFGESHGRCVGVVVDGCPAGLKVSEQDIQDELNLRRPVSSEISTTRIEEDKVEILSGIFEGYTTGAPICMLVWNRDVDSRPYEEFFKKPRPGHADFTARMKYKGFNDYRGGGRFSGRITASYVMAGALAKKLLKETLSMEVIAYTLEIGGVRAKNIDADFAKKFRYENEVRTSDPEVVEEMKRVIIKAKNKGDSVGGIVECIVRNVPVGLGEPIFSSLESDLSKAIFSIPAAKGIEFGAGFSLAKMKGSESNDPFDIKNGKVITKTNRSGGILGGISNGMPIVLRVVFKPASSITIEQDTVNLINMKKEKIRVLGRHDPCIVPRAVPIVESMVSITLADHAIRAGFIPSVLGEKVG
jgi:chorismate synthase